ncbi:MAG: nickel-dependent hydrogenase large subunit [Sandaracinaceae bacterium]|nr:nickel-dependent hydrogenase large subunit [Sandaracinaceae bacterium]
MGFGSHEAPRGALGHWIQIEDKKIKNYQAVVPTTWNAGPRDASGQRGAYEAARLNTPVANPGAAAGAAADDPLVRPPAWPAPFTPSTCAGASCYGVKVR